MQELPQLTLAEVAALMKHRGFVFPSSEIYGGLSAAYDYGPLGIELRRHIEQHWWKTFVHDRQDMYGLDTAIFMNPKVWEASGHTQHFTDPLIECKQCHKRQRPDKLIEEILRKKKKPLNAVQWENKKSLEKALETLGVSCPECGESAWTPIRDFNTLFETYQGVVKESENIIYLRGEIAQGMFVNFKNVVQSMRAKLPFGIAQQGKAFRNEVTVKRFIFRTREFHLMEIEYFVEPNSAPEQLEQWKESIRNWYIKNLGIAKEHLQWREQTKEERAHYSQGTWDLEYQFPWGFDEIAACANRGDFDLKNHAQVSGEELSILDPVTRKKILPYVIEPTFGIDRAFLAVFLNALEVVKGGRSGESKQTQEIVLHLPKHLAPIQVAVMPLFKKTELIQGATQVFHTVGKQFRAELDVTQSIGKRYRRQDEIGTPWCITYDFESLTDHKVTVRDRDSMRQERITINSLLKNLTDFFQQ